MPQNQDFSVPNGKPLTEQLGFLAHSVIVDNRTSSYIYIKGAGRWVDPGLGAGMQIDGTQVAEVEWSAPPGKVQIPPVAGEEAQVIFYTDTTPPGTGLTTLTPISVPVFPSLSVTGLSDLKGGLQVEGAARFQGPDPWIDVTHPSYGADNTGASDSGVAIARAFAALPAGGGIVWFPPGTYLISAPLNPPANTKLLGSKFSTRSGVPRTTVITGPGMITPLISTASQMITVDSLCFNGNAASSTSEGIVASDFTGWCIENCEFSNFGGSAIRITGGNTGMIRRCKADNSLLVRSGRVAYVGVFDLAGNDNWVLDNEVTASSTGDDSGGGWITAIVIRGSMFFLAHNIAEISETGYVFTSANPGFHKVVGCRADVNFRDGWIIQSGGNIFGVCQSYRNGLLANNTYDGFVVTGQSNTFDDCASQAGGADPNKMRYGFNDSAAAGAGPEAGNRYSACRSTNLATRTYNFSTAGTWATVAGVDGVQSIPYAANITPDGVGGAFVAVGTLTAAITINAPINAVSGARLCFSFLEGGAGAFAVTFAAGAGAFISSFSNVGNAAGTRSTIEFAFDNVANRWIQTSAQRLWV